jgi:hypothetical protein
MTSVLPTGFTRVVLGGEVIHPLLVGGDEDIGRRPCLDLPGERGRGGERESYRILVHGFIFGAKVLQSVGQARGSEHGDRFPPSALAAVVWIGGMRTR